MEEVDDNIIIVKATPTRTVFEKDDFYIYGVIIHPEDEEKVELNNWGNITLQTDIELDLHKLQEMEIRYMAESKYPSTYSLVSIKYGLSDDPKEQADYIKALVTEKQYESIYNVYSEHRDRVATLILEDKFDIEKVKGIGTEYIARIKSNLESRIDMNELITYLRKYDVSMKCIERIHKFYGDSKRAIKKIEDNPYNLLQVKGIGFIKADAIALSLGVDPESEERILNGLFYVIQEEIFKQGNTFAAKEFTVRRLSSLLEISRKAIEKTLNVENAEKYNIILQDNLITTLAMFRAENYIANTIIENSKSSNELMPEKVITEFLEYYSKEKGIELSEEQSNFLYSLNTSQINFLIGGGGVGKTFTVSVVGDLISYYQEKYEKVLKYSLCAPTGRASKVMSSYVGKPASTIHKLLNIALTEEEGEGRNGEFDTDGEPLDSSIKLIMVDEISMADIPLVYKLMKKIDTSSTKLLFIGDDYQIPSVGAGNFLFDCLNCENPAVNITKLTKVYRIKEGGVAQVSQKIRNQIPFLNYGDSGRVKFGNDLVFRMLDSRDEIAENIVSSYESIINNGYRPEDIIVLSPKNVGELGVKRINDLIQEAINPLDFDEKQVEVGKDDKKTFYRLGDRILNLVNMYEVPLTNENFDIKKTEVYDEASGETTEIIESTDVYNGEIGTIIAINADCTKIVVKYDEREVLYKKTDLNGSISLGYCMTIHKAQGGQAPYVIMACDKGDTYQLNANLIYTGLTRTQKACLILTQPTTMLRALDKFVNMRRDTRLLKLLKNGSLVKEETPQEFAPL